MPTPAGGGGGSSRMSWLSRRTCGSSRAGRYAAAMANDRTEHLTQGQKEQLEAELAELEGPRRKEVVEAISVARGFGDLSENFEYHAAKNEQGLLERKITILRARLEDAEIVEGGDPEVVSVGSHVVIEDGDGGRM